MANKCGKNGNSEFSLAPKSLEQWLQSWIYKMLAPWKESYYQLRQHIKKQRHHFANKGLYSQSYGFSSSHIWDVRIGPSRGWAPKNWCFRTVVLGKTPESPLDGKEIEPVDPKGNQPWMLIGRTDAKAEAPILWIPDMKSQVTGKDFDAGKDWGQVNEVTGWDG